MGIEIKHIFFRTIIGVNNTDAPFFKLSDIILIIIIIKEFDTYMSKIDYYPFQLYIHWIPEDCGNLLFNDGKFLNIIYKQHDDVFTDLSKYKDAHSETKNNIYNFIEKSYKVAIAVDCENSDVYKLYSVLKNLNQDELEKIEKIVLYDDYHTNCGWVYRAGKDNNQSYSYMCQILLLKHLIFYNMV